MSQRKITDMMPSQGTSKRRLADTAHSKMDRRERSNSLPAGNSRFQSVDELPSTEVRPRGKAAGGRARTPTAVSSVSIPSTPNHEFRASSSRQREPPRGRRQDSVPETPPRAASRPPSNAPSIPNTRIRRTASSVKTPTRNTAAASEGGSPYTAIDLSSSSDSSDCEIQHVQPSPNRKRISNAGASVPRQSSVPIGRRVPSGRRSSSVRPQTRATLPANLKIQLSSTGGTKAPSSSAPPPSLSKRFASIKQEYTRRIPIQQFFSQASKDERDNSDCFIEKVQTSPRTSQPCRADDRPDTLGSLTGIAALKGVVTKPNSLNRKPSRCNQSTPRSLDRLDDAGAEEALVGQTQTVKDRANTLPLLSYQTPQRSNVIKTENRKTTLLPKPVHTPQSIDLTEVDSSDSDSDSDSDSSDDTPVANPATISKGGRLQRGSTPFPSPPRDSSFREKEPIHLWNDYSQHTIDSRNEQLSARVKRAASPSPSSASGDGESFCTAPESQSSQLDSIIKAEHADRDVLRIKLEHNSDDDSSSPCSYQDSSDESDEEPAVPPSYQTPALASCEYESESENELPELHRNYSPYHSPSRRELLTRKTPSPMNVSRNAFSTPGIRNQGCRATQPPMTPSCYKLGYASAGDDPSSSRGNGTSGGCKPLHRSYSTGLRSILKEPKRRPAHLEEDAEGGKAVSFSPLRYTLGPNGKIFLSPIEQIQSIKTEARTPRMSSLPSPNRRLKEMEDKATVVKVKSPTPVKSSTSKLAIRQSQDSPSKPSTKSLLHIDRVQKGKVQSPDIVESHDTKCKSRYICSVRLRCSANTPTDSVARKLYDDPVAPTSGGSHNGDGSERKSVDQILGTKRHLIKSDSDTRDSKKPKLSDQDQPRAHKQESLKPIVASNAWSPKSRDFKPVLIRDGVSEHAIKPTIALLEQKIARGERVFANCPAHASSSGFQWATVWDSPRGGSRHTSRAMAAELRHRGIKSDVQYGNFWYNLMMAYSRLAGSSVPLFTMQKKAFEDFETECLGIRRDLRREPIKEKVKQPEGLDALLLWGAGETDEESESTGSSDAGDLVTKIHENIKKQRLARQR